MYDPLGILTEEKPKNDQQVDPLGILPKVKKKETGIVPSKIGGEVGVSKVQLDENIPDEYGRVGWMKTLPPPMKLESKDPINDAFAVVQQKEFESLHDGKWDSLLKAKKSIKEQKSILSSIGGNGTIGKKAIDRIIGDDSDKYSVQELQQKAKGNITATKSVEAIADKRKIDEAINTTTDLYRAANKYETGKENEDQRDISEEKQGANVYAFINNPNVIERAKHDPEFSKHLKEAQFNFANHFPTEATKMVNQKIGQYMEDHHRTNLLYNNPGKDKVNKVVDEMIEKGLLDEKEAFIYHNNTEQNLGTIKSYWSGSPIQTKDITNEFSRGVTEGGKGVESSIRDITNKITGGIFQKSGLIETDEDRAKRLEQEETGTANIEAREGKKGILSATHFLGFATPIILGELAGVPTEATMTAQFEGINHDYSLQKYPHDKTKQDIYTILATTADVFGAKLLPTKQAATALKSAFQKEAVSIIDDVAAKKITEYAAKDKLNDFFVDIAKNSGNATAAMRVMDLAHNGIEAALGGKNFNVAEQAKRTLENIPSDVLNASFLSGIAASRHLFGKENTKQNESTEIITEEPKPITEVNEPIISPKETEPAKETVSEVVQPTTEKPKVSVILSEENKKPEVVSLKTGEQPPKPPISEPPKSKIYVERPDTELSHRGLQVVANEFSLPDVKTRDTKTDIELRNDAQKTIGEWINKKEYSRNVEGLVQKAEAGDILTDKERVILEQHLANVSGELRGMKVSSPEFDQKLAEIKRLKEAGEKTRSEAGAALRIPSWHSQSRPVENYADALVSKMDANGVDVLTEVQKKEVQDQVKVYEERTKAAELKVADLESKMAEMEAGKEISKITKSKKATSKKTSEDYKKERAKYIEELKSAKYEHEKWLKDQGIQKLGGSGITLTPKMIKAIGKIVASHVEEIGNNITEITKRVFNEVKEYFDGISESDIHNIIAGVHNEPKKTLTDLQVNLKELHEEARLLNYLDNVSNGVTKNPKQEIKKNKKLKELRDRLKQLKKDVGYDDESKLLTIKNKNIEQAKLIRQKIADKDFETSKRPKSIFDNKELQKKYPKLYKQTLDAISAKEDAAHDFDVALYKDQLKIRSKIQKGFDFLGAGANTTKKLVTGIDDSSLFIQTLAAMAAHPYTAVKAIRHHALDFASKKRFDRWLTELHNSPDWKLIKESGLDVTEPMSLSEKNREEIFSGKTWDITVRYGGKEFKILESLLSPFERAFTSLGNGMRVIAFRSLANKLIKEKYTFQNNPQKFKDLALMLNTETGRGKQNEYIQKASELVTKGIWSPKLMASRLNMLGISDISSLFLSKAGTKGYYRQLDPTIRKEAIKDLVQFAATVMAVSFGVAWSFGGQVDLDPTSKTFLDIKFKNGKSYNLSGGFSQYIRVIAQTVAGGRSSDGKFQPFNGRYDSGGNLLHFARGKATPLFGVGIDLLTRKDFMGRPITVGGEVKKLVVPLSLQGVITDVKRDGLKSLFNSTLPSFVGINVKDERDFQKSTPSSTKPKKSTKSHKPVKHN